MYVTFFPQLVAGPIVRASDFLPQCAEPKKIDWNAISWGMLLLILGLFQKVVIADSLLAPVVEALFDNAQMHPSFTAAWAGTLAFSGQIFCDFSGYSACAIGAARCLGFSLPRNFHFPYAALGFSDFWKRWHISLSSWLRDYLYIPLGGNRRGRVRTQVNLMLTMLLGGLWHGASWTFVTWGGLHGLLLLVEKGLSQVKMRALDGLMPIIRPLAIFATFIAICFTWVFFRAKTFGQACRIVKSMIGFADHGATSIMSSLVFTSFALAALIFCVHYAMRDTGIVELVDRAPKWAVAGAVSLMLYAICTVPGPDRAFIYFQF
jgi:D-alanyl-lipoteichoic acid acyltransferase DltB (MBOAT superfamily)